VGLREYIFTEGDRAEGTFIKKMGPASYAKDTIRGSLTRRFSFTQTPKESVQAKARSFSHHVIKNGGSQGKDNVQ